MSFAFVSDLGLRNCKLSLNPHPAENCEVNF